MPTSYTAVIARGAFVLLSVVVGAGCGSGEPPVGNPARELHPAISCAGCHQQIYDEWKGSFHAQSLASKTFRDGLAWYLRDAGHKAAFCIDCHSPAAKFAGNQQEVARKVLAGETEGLEGVTCDVCHSVASVDLDSLAPTAKLTLLADARVKVGPFADAVPNGFHESRQSALISTSEFCYACHEYREGHSESAIHAGRTYSQWKSSAFAAKGTQCQDCHMAPEMRRLVEGGPVRKVFSHRFDGPRSPGSGPGTLAAAVTLSLDVEWRDGATEVRVTLENTGAAHSIPDG